MKIDKLKKHLENTPFEELEKEWELVKDFKDTSPNALDIIQYWGSVEKILVNFAVWFNRINRPDADNIIPYKDIILYLKWMRDKKRTDKN